MEVSEPVGAALDEFHFAVEAFGDAVVFGEAPHPHDFLLPLLQSGCEGQHGGDLEVFEVCNQFQKAGNEPFTPAFGLVLEGEESVNRVHFFVHGNQRRELQKEGLEFGSLGGLESVGFFPKEPQMASSAIEGWRDLAGELQEVMLNDPDAMETVGHDEGVWEKSADDASVGDAQIDADHPDPVPAGKLGKGIVKTCGGFPLEEIEDAVIGEITEGGGKACLFVEGVFVNPEDPGALGGDAFLCFF